MPFRILKDSSIYNNDKSAAYGDNVMMIDISGEGIYLGNMTSKPDRIAVNNISNLATKDELNKLLTNTELRFFCIEPVVVSINDDVYTYPENTLVDIFLRTDDVFSVEPTSNKSIRTLSAWPGAINTFYPWLNGVQVFDGILFDMNSEDMYVKWNQNNQGQYDVQFAQYTNCIFWSDNPYINDIAIRTNYILYNSFQLPLCYSNIPENTYKPFYCAYGVKSDPNWSNQLYIDSFALTTTATAPFTYYGMNNIGVFNMAIAPIKLPKDCRGLMFYSPAIERAGVFDASNTTNFGAKSGSWREAFGYCDSLKTLYISNLKASLNLSWSPIEIDSIEHIISNAANTSKITLSLSPYTWYRLTDEIKNSAQAKNITLELISTNMNEDGRLGEIGNIYWDIL